MPIIKMDKHLYLSFGYGDIAVGVINKKAKWEKYELAFFQTLPGALGPIYDEKRKDYGGDCEVVMSFHKIKSLDTIIEALQVLRRAMKEKEESEQKSISEKQKMAGEI